MCGFQRFLHSGRRFRPLLVGAFLLAFAVSLSAQASPTATTNPNSTQPGQTSNTTKTETPSTTATLDQSFDSLLTIIGQLEANSNNTNSIVQQLSQLSSEQLRDLQAALPLLVNMAPLLNKMKNYTERLDALLPTLEKLSDLSPEKSASQKTSHWSLGGFGGITSDAKFFGGFALNYSF